MCLSCQNATGLCRQQEIQRLQQGHSSDEEGDGNNTTDSEGISDEEDDASGRDVEDDEEHR